MNHLFENYLLLFFVCSILGWLLEVICKLHQFHRFINRGFLIGPYCPIYGFGAVCVCLALSRFIHDPAAVFLLAMVICGILEYLTSYIMEKLFHARWWDYSSKHFNLNGRVCADTLIPFGIFGILLVYWIKPFFFSQFDLLPTRLRTVICLCLSVLMLIDMIVSMNVLGKICKTANRSHGDDTESITRAVREKLSEQGVLVRRAMRAFPYARLYNSQLLRHMKDQQQQLAASAKEKQLLIRQEINNREKRLREELKSMKKFRQHTSNHTKGNSP